MWAELKKPEKLQVLDFGLDHFARLKAQFENRNCQVTELTEYNFKIESRSWQRPKTKILFFLWEMYQQPAGKKIYRKRFEPLFWI